MLGKTNSRLMPEEIRGVYLEWKEIVIAYGEDPILVGFSTKFKGQIFCIDTYSFISAQNQKSKYNYR